MRIEFKCGCSIIVKSDGYGGLDTTFFKPCKTHLTQIKKKVK